MQVWNYANMQLSSYARMQACKNANIQLCMYTKTSIQKLHAETCFLLLVENEMHEIKEK